MNSSNIANAGSREFNFPTEAKKHDIGEGVSCHDDTVQGSGKQGCRCFFFFLFHSFPDLLTRHVRDG